MQVRMCRAKPGLCRALLHSNSCNWRNFVSKWSKFVIAHLYRQLRATCTNCWLDQLPQKVLAVSLPLLALVRAGQSQHTTHNVLVQVKVGRVSCCTILGEDGCSLCYLALLRLLLGMPAAQEKQLSHFQLLLLRYSITPSICLLIHPPGFRG